MEMNELNLQIEEDVNSATVCAEGEELSVCNTENDETVTVYASEDATEEAVEESRKQKLARKCREVKSACQSTAERLAYDWKETNGNPYIKQTCTYQVDIYRSPDDEEPVDTFRTQRVKGYTARTAAVVGGIGLILMCTAECVVKKLLGKD